MDSATFIPLFTNPTSYPPDGATLLPMETALAGVRPEIGTMAGKLHAVMTWSVDVPTDFEIGIDLELVSEGTASSPGKLTFSATSIIDPVIVEQTVTLENCGPEAAFVSYDRVIAGRGKPNAWFLDPPFQARELLPEERMRVVVSFVPKEPGVHEARLDVDVGGGLIRTVLLEGEATGALDEKTSFYACNCSGGGRGAWTSWLIVGARVHAPATSSRTPHPC
jgi:hypothetical protein